jgi:hypothetical protein
MKPQPVVVLKKIRALFFGLAVFQGFAGLAAARPAEPEPQPVVVSSPLKSDNSRNGENKGLAGGVDIIAVMCHKRPAGCCDGYLIRLPAGAAGFSKPGAGSILLFEQVRPGGWCRLPAAVRVELTNPRFRTGSAPNWAFKPAYASSATQRAETILVDFQRAALTVRGGSIGKFLNAGPAAPADRGPLVKVFAYNRFYAGQVHQTAKRLVAFGALGGRFQKSGHGLLLFEEAARPLLRRYMIRLAAGAAGCRTGSRFDCTLLNRSSERHSSKGKA